MSNKTDKSDALIFIDTNIILDFYRYSNCNAVISALKHIDKNHDKIIINTQVEMEYKKNRQKVIIASQLKFPNQQTFMSPVIFEDLQAKKIIVTNLDTIEKQSKKLIKKMAQIVKNPGNNDIVYQAMQRLFKNKSNLNLKRSNKLRFTIRNLAKKRFILGYPPRKNSDTSIGDAINWEWIIACAKEAKQNVVIVSRDTDYGCNFIKETIINDWLLQEFKERVGRKELILTSNLMEGFQLAGINITKDDIEQEEVSLKQEKL